LISDGVRGGGGNLLALGTEKTRKLGRTLLDDDKKEM